MDRLDHGEAGVGWMTVQDVARLAGVNTRTVQRWADDETLPSIRTLGGHRRFDEDAVKVALAEADRYGGIATPLRVAE